MWPTGFCAAHLLHWKIEYLGTELPSTAPAIAGMAPHQHLAGQPTQSGSGFAALKAMSAKVHMPLQCTQATPYWNATLQKET
jgi:hypothetical protein